MKTKKLDLLDFKQNELSREYISTVKAGEPINPKPPGASTGSGSGGGQVCYYDFEGELLYCESRETDPVKGESLIP